MTIFARVIKPVKNPIYINDAAMIAAIDTYTSQESAHFFEKKIKKTKKISFFVEKKLENHDFFMIFLFFIFQTRSCCLRTFECRRAQTGHRTCPLPPTHYYNPLYDPPPSASFSRCYHPTSLADVAQTHASKPRWCVCHRPKKKKVRLDTF